MKKGFALITVLAILIILAVGTATLLQSVGSLTNMKSNNVQEVKARYLAEAGVQYALWVCRNNNGNCAAAAGTRTKAQTGLEQDIVITLPNPGQIRTTINYNDV